MSEERPGEDGTIARVHGTGAPAAPVHLSEDVGAAGVAGAPPLSPAAADDEISVEEGEPETTFHDPALLAPSRRMLRIPDDEVSRPSPSHGEGVSSEPLKAALPKHEPFEASGGPPIAASRIITINPHPMAEPVAEVVKVEVKKSAYSLPDPESIVAGADELAAASYEDGWTPHHPTVKGVSVQDQDDVEPGLESAESEPLETAKEASGPDIVVEEDVDSAPSPAPASDADVVALDSVPPPRSSESGELVEVMPEDVVSIESPPLKIAASKVVLPSPLASPVASKPPPTPSPRPPPLLLVPGLASPLAPPPVNEASAAARRKARPWWEELFNDDFIRTMAKVTDAQIAIEVDFIEESLGLAGGAVVLDLACGTGRHAIEMTRRGYQVVGFDLSLAMLARAADEAQERDQKLNFVQGDMREMTFGETFDGVYVWNTSFGFFEEEKNSAVIANVHRALKPGGLLLLDVANRDFVIRQSPSLAWFEGDGCVCMDEMHVDSITSRMRVKRTVMLDDGRAKEIEYSIRIYALHELGKILHDQGFRVAEVSGRVATPGAFIGADSPRILVVAEKR
jgi:SAM-dependent methyltransferase